MEGSRLVLTTHTSGSGQTGQAAESPVTAAASADARAGASPASRIATSSNERQTGRSFIAIGNPAAGVMGVVIIGTRDMLPPAGALQL